MVKNKYDRIIEQFETYYPYLYEQTADWWPSGRLHITVKLTDGMLFEFDSITNTIRRIHTDNQTSDADTLKKEIGSNIQKMISTRGIPQSHIAERVGITDAMLSRYIHGTSMPGVDKLYNIAAVLGCRVTDLVGESYFEEA